MKQALGRARAPASAPAQDPSVDTDVGHRVRTRRKQAGLSLVDVATRTGLSIGYLSQMERGLSSPTLRALTSLSDALGTPLSGMLAGGAGLQGESRIVRASASRPVTMWGSGIRKTLLAGGPMAQGGSFALCRMEFSAGADSGLEPYAHEGFEAGLVTQGVIALTLGDELHELAEGDSFQFPSTVLHRFRNAARRRAVMLIVNLKPDPSTGADASPP